MNELKNKSEINLDSAKLLSKNNYYAPSVHCSYYSVLQLMKYAVCVSIGISYDEQDKEINQLKQHKASAKGTHEYLIGKIEEKIHEFDRPNFTSFTRKVKDLKVFRKNSDYEDVSISFEQSRTAIDHATVLREQIKKTFKV